LSALLGCAAAPSLEEARLSSPSPEISSCAQWLHALDAEVAAAGVRDLHYWPISGFPYLRADRYLAGSRDLAAARASAFEAFADRLLEHDLESRRYEIDNLPAALVEKWSGMRFDNPREVALRRTVQCGRLLRERELSRPQMREALLEHVVLPPSSMPGAACAPHSGPPAGARVRYSPPPRAMSRAAAAGWLLRADLDPLNQPLVPDRELRALAAAYAPSFEVAVASDADRFGALRFRRGARRPEIDATDPAVYVRHSYARYEDRALLQVIYTVLFPENRIAWRVTLAPDAEPLVYEASGADGCYAVILTPRARLRERSLPVMRELPRLRDDARPLVAVAAGTHRIDVREVVAGTDSLARYELRPYAELRSAPALEGRHRAAVTQPVLDDADRLAARFAFDLAEAPP
jgi:hypothetical protein